MDIFQNLYNFFSGLGGKNITGGAGTGGRPPAGSGYIGSLPAQVPKSTTQGQSIFSNIVSPLVGAFNKNISSAYASTTPTTLTTPLQLSAGIGKKISQWAFPMPEYILNQKWEDSVIKSYGEEKGRAIINKMKGETEQARIDSLNAYKGAFTSTFNQTGIVIGIIVVGFLLLYLRK